jgi:hypothetical protein
MIFSSVTPYFILLYILETLPLPGRSICGTLNFVKNHKKNFVNTFYVKKLFFRRSNSTIVPVFFRSYWSRFNNFNTCTSYVNIGLSSYEVRQTQKKYRYAIIIKKGNTAYDYDTEKQKTDPSGGNRTDRIPHSSRHESSRAGTTTRKITPMKITLINPWIHDFAAYDLWAKPLGLLYIGSFLEQNGFEVDLIDCMDRLHPSVEKDYRCKQFTTGKFHSEEIEKPAVLKNIPRIYKRYGIPVTSFLSALERSKPELIIMTSHMTYWYPGVFEAIGLCKKIVPSVPLILGGIYARLCHEHAKEHSGADHVLQESDPGALLKIIDSIAPKERDYSLVTTDIFQNPYPAYHLYPELTTVSMITSVGCPMRCSYCASSILQPRFKERSARAVFDEITYYLKRFPRVSEIALYDDALLLNAETRFIPLATLIHAARPRISFHTPNSMHIKNVTAEVARWLFKAHFKAPRLSLESIGRAVQKASSQKATAADLINARDNLLKAGYKSTDIEVYLLVGLTEDDDQTVLRSIEFVHSLGLIVRLERYAPVPGTVEFKRAAKCYPFLLTDPLFHNNTVFSYKAAGNAESLEKTAQHVRDLNARI